MHEAMKAPIYVVYAPAFDENSGGAVALHRLVHVLRSMGEEACLWPMRRPSRSASNTASFLAKSAYYRLLRWKNGPFLQNQDFDTTLAADDPGPRHVVIYPETTHGNPLGAINVVRWLLHEPGFHTGRTRFGENDPVFFYRREFASSPEASKLNLVGPLQVRWLRDDVYAPGDPGHREGSCYMVRKGRVAQRAHDSSAVRLDGMSHHEIAAVFQRSRTFYSYDPNTMYSTYAAICGCDSIIVPPENMSRREWYERNERRLGVAFGDEDLDWARSTRHRVLAYQRSQEEQARQTVRAFVEFISEYFGPGSSRDTGRGDASARSTVPEGAIGNVHD